MGMGKIDDLGNMGTVGDIVYWDLTGVTNLSETGKEVLVRLMSDNYVDGVVHKLGTWKRMQRLLGRRGQMRCKAI